MVGGRCASNMHAMAGQPARQLAYIVLLVVAVLCGSDQLGQFGDVRLVAVGQYGAVILQAGRGRGASGGMRARQGQKGGCGVVW